LETFSIVLY